MTIQPDTRELARRLLIYESETGDSSEPELSPALRVPTLRVYEKLRQSLSAFAGVAGFQSLASRALVLARPEAPALGAAQVTEDGYLQGLGEIEHPSGYQSGHPSGHPSSHPSSIVKGTGAEPPSNAGIILIARMLGLLHVFLGEVLTASLLQVTWPGIALDDSDSEKGRKA